MPQASSSSSPATATAAPPPPPQTAADPSPSAVPASEEALDPQTPAPPPQAQPEAVLTAAQKALRSKPARPSEDADKKNKKLKDVEISFPIVYGTISFWLGKKASEYNSHKWTVYVRSATNEDLSVIVKRVVFQLHPSFTNPTRVVEQPPFELSESGWGEFEIAITLYFHSDVCEKRLDLFHQLKLYPEEDTGPQSTKKPVVVETYDEIVFPEPTEAFFQRVQNHPAATVPRLPPGITLPPPGPLELVPHEKKRGDTKDHPLSQWFSNFSEADELLKLAAARQQVQAHIAKLRRQLSMIDGMPQQSKAVSGVQPPAYESMMDIYTWYKVWDNLPLIMADRLIDRWSKSYRLVCKDQTNLHKISNVPCCFASIIPAFYKSLSIAEADKTLMMSSSLI